MTDNKNIDPNELLEKLRDLINDGTSDQEDIIETFEKLDEWLKSGGKLPKDWMPEDKQWIPLPENYEPKVGDVTKPNSDNWPKCGNCLVAESVWHYQASGGLSDHEGPNRKGEKYTGKIALSDSIKYLCDDCVPRGCECTSVEWIDQSQPGLEWEHKNDEWTVSYVAERINNEKPI